MKIIVDMMGGATAPAGCSGRCCTGRQGVRRAADRRGQRGAGAQDRRRAQHPAGRHRAGELHRDHRDVRRACPRHPPEEGFLHRGGSESCSRRARAMPLSLPAAPVRCTLGARPRLCAPCGASSARHWATMVPAKQQAYLLLDCGAGSGVPPGDAGRLCGHGQLLCEQGGGPQEPQRGTGQQRCRGEQGRPRAADAHQLLKTTPGIRFVGNIEPPRCARMARWTWWYATALPAMSSSS